VYVGGIDAPNPRRLTFLPAKLCCAIDAITSHIATIPNGPIPETIPRKTRLRQE
jgi:hypothetical protein